MVLRYTDGAQNSCKPVDVKIIVNRKIPDSIGDTTVFFCFLIDGSQLKYGTGKPSRGEYRQTYLH